MRIFKNRFYVMSKRGKSTVTGDWDQEPTLYLVTGHKAANERPYIGKEFKPDTMCGAVHFRLQNGRLPEYQPQVGVREAMAWLISNRFQLARIVTQQ